MKIVNNFILLIFAELIDTVVDRIASLISGEHRELRADIDDLRSRMDISEKEIEKILKWCEECKANNQ